MYAFKYENERQIIFFCNIFENFYRNLPQLHLYKKLFSHYFLRSKNWNPHENGPMVYILLQYCTYFTLEYDFTVINVKQNLFYMLIPRGYQLRTYFNIITIWGFHFPKINHLLSLQGKKSYKKSKIDIFLHSDCKFILKVWKHNILKLFEIIAILRKKIFYLICKE